MKHRIRIVSLILGLVMLLGLGVWLPERAAEAEEVDVYLSLSANEIKTGESVTVTIHASGDALASMTLTLSYPAGILEYSGGSGSISGGNGSLKASFSGNGSVSATFKAIATGSARVSTSGTAAYDSDQNPLSIAHAGVTIEVGAGTGATTEQKSTEKTSEDASTEEATDEPFGELPDGIVEVEKEEEIPAGYTATTAEYKKKKIPAYISPNKVVKIVARTNQDGQIQWYQLKEASDELIPYVEYSPSNARYILLDKPSNVAVPEGYTEDKINLGHGDVKVYRSKAVEDIVLVYGVSLQGVEGFYQYDTIEGTFLRYVQPAKDTGEEKDTEEMTTEATTERATQQLQEPVERRTKEDEGIFTRDNLIKMLFGALGLFLVMAILAIVLMIKNARLQGVAQEEDPEEDSPIRRISRNGEYVEPVEEAGMKEEETEGDKEEGSGEPQAASQETVPSEVTGETIEIILEAAEDNNSSVHVPPAEDPEKNTLEDAMKSRPYGIDSAFDVVDAEQVDKTEEVHVKSEEPQRVALPTEGDDDEETE